MNILFQKIEEKNFPQVLTIYKSNEAYFTQASNTWPTIQTVRDDFQACPPNLPIHEKHYELVCLDGQAVAVVDMLTNFPVEGTVHIGLFMVHSRLQKTGLGTSIFKVLEQRMCSFQKLRLGVFEANPHGLSFWQRNGFTNTDVKETVIIEKKHKIYVLEKPITRN